jgi:membrane-associated phospholipid phosphatase
VGVTLVVLTVALLAGIVGFAVSASQAVAIDPRGPIERHPRVRRFLRERFDRDTRRGFLVTAAFAILFAVALVVGGLLDMVNAGSGLAELDDEVAEWGSGHASSTTVDVLQVVADLGGTPVVMVALATTGVVAYRRTRKPEILVFLAAVGIGQLVLVNLIKVIVDRDRPNVLQLVGVHGPSFPSGHSAAAAACWAAVAFVLGHDAPRTTRAVLAAAAVVVAVAVATSRALLGVHWLTDIVAGLAVGWGWFALVLLAFRTRERTVAARQVAR